MYYFLQLGLSTFRNNPRNVGLFIIYKEDSFDGFNGSTKLEKHNWVNYRKFLEFNSQSKDKLQSFRLELT